MVEDHALDLRPYVDICLSWWWVLLLGPLLAGALAVAYTMVRAPTPPAPTPQVYEATATLLLEGDRGPNDALELVNAVTVLAQARDSLSADASVDASVEAIQTAVTASAIPNTELVEIKAKHTDPVVAAAMANSVGESLVRNLGALREARMAGSPPELAGATGRIGWTG